MKRILGLLVVLFISQQTFAQGINQIDADGKRDGVWKKYFEDTNILRYEGQFKHGKEVGLFKFYKKYKKQAVLSATKLFNDTSNIADVKFLASNGKVISEGQMNGKLHIGTWKYYQKNSDEILTLETYNSNGELIGERLVYYPNGAVAERKQYSNGKLEGISYTYTDTNLVLTESEYENDELHGVSKSYNPKGQIISEGVFKRGKKTGVWKFYENGKLVNEKNFSYTAKRTKKTP
ncbi:toxin-antitoxin system YwqK family antitoxin [Tamlana sp. 2_MG-2023]|uniref:toxin-antitoxin system YwqK family antitoxin n=1 Tax=unclassified Tamlana TaxID=2614803 RepID=UPI0026E2D202|nr:MULTISPECIES: toxin-antitoxin system YwqK family antitoxin [unclassified Tamlana]MDO6758944.1 toxin-antitoxin system YwqK family antitoxin [Tamlana sp. 2_MG-2023]MDO6789643.1 toxin-antitoxin system YwqK family antitoxin [Tamlana sp. 1_MG-2023]